MAATTHPLPAAVFCAALAFAVSADAQTAEVLYQLEGFPVGGIWRARDMNGDGFPEFMVSWPEAIVNGLRAGRASVRSGKDGSILLSMGGQEDNGYFGADMLSLSDEDGDGTPDFGVVSFPRAPGSVDYLEIRSGRDASVILRLDEGGASLPFFGKLKVVGDVNGDGFDDLINGSSHDDRTGTSRGRVMVISGRNGKILFDKSGPPNSEFGTSLAGVGDIDGDGCDDFLVGAPFDKHLFNDIGEVVLFSGRAGNILKVFRGDRAGDGFGNPIAFAGDVNGDGTGDFFFGLPWFRIGMESNRGKFRIVSGADGAVLFEALGEMLQSLGSAGAPEGDVNGDGFDDYLVRGGGPTKLYSGRDGEILYEFDSFTSDSSNRHHPAWDVNQDGFPDMTLANGYRRTLTAYLGAPPLRLFGPDPGLVGQVNTLTVTGAAPGARVTFLAGLNDQITRIPCLTGTQHLKIPIGHLVANLDRNADATGSLQLSFLVPPRMSGRTVRLLAMEFAGCRESRLVTHFFP